MPADRAVKKGAWPPPRERPLTTITASESQAGCFTRSVVKRASGKSGSGGPLLRWKSKKTKDIRLLRVSGLSRGKSNGWRDATAYPVDAHVRQWDPPVVNESGICGHGHLLVY
jgi:hypothetical protein